MLSVILYQVLIKIILIEIDNLTKGRLIWKVYYYHPDEKEKLKNNLLDIGIDTERIKLIPSEEFYDL